jgi:hypothetical protein
VLLRKRILTPQAAISAGMTSVALGIVSLRYLHQVTHLSQAFIDHTAGFFCGAGIGLLILGISVSRGRHLRPDGGTHA